MFGGLARTCATVSTTKRCRTGASWSGLLMRWVFYDRRLREGRESPQAVLGVGTQVVAEGSPLVVGAEQAALLQDRDNSIDEGIHPIDVNVREDPETVGCSGFEPFLHVVCGGFGRADGGGVVVDDSVVEHLAYGPALPGDLECCVGARIAGIGACHGQLGGA